MESKKRTLVRTVMYRALAVVLLAVISWIYTGNVLETSAITIVYSVLATLIDYVHDRIWFRIDWGKIKARKLSN